MAKAKEASKKKKGPGKKGGGPGKTGKSGLTPMMHRGMDPDRSVGGGGNFAPRAKLKGGDSGVFQFLAAPGDPSIVEIEEHQWKEKGRWNYVPCLGDDCPLCKDSDPDVAKTAYKVYVPVYDFSQKKAVLLSGPKTLRRVIIDRWGKSEKSKKEFLNRTWDISKLKESPWWDIDRGEKKPLNDKARKALELPDAAAHVQSEMEQFFGSKTTSKLSKKSKGKEKPSALDDEPYTKKGLKKLGQKKLIKIAEAFGCKKPNKLDEGDLIEFILRKQG